MDCATYFDGDVGALVADDADDGVVGDVAQVDGLAVAAQQVGTAVDFGHQTCPTSRRYFSSSFSFFNARPPRPIFRLAPIDENQLFIIKKDPPIS